MNLPERFETGSFVLDGNDLGVVVGYKNGSVDVQFPSRRAFIDPKWLRPWPLQVDDIAHVIKSDGFAQWEKGATGQIVSIFCDRFGWHVRIRQDNWSGGILLPPHCLELV